jgi:hypothetical protein
MTLHPDILTDLVVLYHAGEASQASRALLEEEATRNPQIAAALAARSRTIPALPANPALDERKVLRKVRLRYQAISFGVVWTLALLSVVLLPRFASTSMGVEIAIALVPLAILVLFFAGGLGALYFFIRAVR